jgi:hypothetical protein
MFAIASSFNALVGTAVDVVSLFMALLSFVESAPRAYRLKASNAAPPISTSIGTIPGDRRILNIAMFEVGLRRPGIESNSTGPDLSANIHLRAPQADRSRLGRYLPISCLTPPSLISPRLNNPRKPAFPLSAVY